MAIDPLIDMARTMLNVSGSVTNALIIDKRLGNLDENIYNEINKNYVCEFVKEVIYYKFLVIYCLFAYFAIFFL